MIFFDLPKEILIKIYSFNPLLNECLDELNHFIINHKRIMVTYSCVHKDHQKYFRRFDPIFYKYFFLNYK